MSKIEAHEHSIATIFGESYEFEIPPYQRPYSWGDEQVRALLADLLDAMDNQQANGGLYFLGSVVLVKSPNVPQSKIIDGQQRLTTLTILLSILRDLTEDVEKRLDRGRYVYQKENADLGLRARCRLFLRDRDRAFFRNYIQEPGATGRRLEMGALEGSQRLIAENTVLLRSLLQPLKEERRDALIAFMLQHCHMVVVAVETHEAARRIFTVLNARGLDLAPTDILKADLLERAGSRWEIELAARWEEVENQLGRDAMVELFGHIRMMHERDKPRHALEVGFGKLVPLFVENQEKFVSNILEPLADAFLLLNDSRKLEARFGSEVAKVVRSLNRIDNKDWIPPVLLRIWRATGRDSAEIEQFITDIERVAYFLFVSRAGVNERIARFSAVMDWLEPRRDLESSKVALALSETEQRTFVRVLAGPLYTVSRVCKPVLYRLDEALSTGGARYGDIVSIEHVLPQKVAPDSSWSSIFPDEQQRSEWVHRVANLVLLTRRVNARASNWDFERKRKEYFSGPDGSSPFPITQGVLRATRWTPAHLDERQRELLREFCQVWRLDPKLLDEQPLLAARPASARRVPDTGAYEAKREQIAYALGRKHGTELRGRRSRYMAQGGELRAVISVSNRNTGTKRKEDYWYAYSKGERLFLSEASLAFFVFACVDTDIAYAVPIGELERILTEFHRTEGRHWHITLHENELGGLDLVAPGGSRFSLRTFEIRLGSAVP